MANGVMMSGSGFGMLITPQIMRFLYDNFSWRETFVILGAASAQVCILGALLFSLHEENSSKVSGDDCLSRLKKILSNFLCLCLKESRSKREFTVTCDNEKGENNCESDIINDIDDSDRETFHPITVLISHEDDGAISIRKEGVDSYDDKGSGLQETHRLTDFDSSSTSRISDKPDMDRQLIMDKVFRPGRLREDLSHHSSPKLFFHSQRHIGESNGHLKHYGAQPHSYISSMHSLTKDRNVRRQVKNHYNFIHFNDNRNKSHLDLPMVIKPKHPENRITTSNDGSLQDSKTGSGFIVVSRNPSLLLGLVPSMHQLDLIVCDSKEDLEKHKHGNFLERNIVFKSTQNPRDAEEFEEKGTDYSCHNTDNCKETLNMTQIRYPPLYKNHLFWTLNLGLFVYNAGCGLFNIHVPSFLSETKGLTPQQISNAISTHGLMTLFGRVLAGTLANSTKDLDLLLYIMMQILGGLSICLMPPLGNDYWSSLVLMGIIAVHPISTYALLPTLTIQYVGVHHLATAFGIEMVFAGLGYLVAPPLAGTLVDLTGNYNYSMYISGVLFMLAGFILFSVPWMLSSLPWYSSTSTKSPSNTPTNASIDTLTNPRDNTPHDAVDSISRDT